MRRIITLIAALATALSLTACQDLPTVEDLKTKANPSTSSAPVEYAGNFRAYDEVDTDAERITLARTVVKSLPTVPDDYEAVDGYERSCSDGQGCVFGPSWHDDNGFRGTGRNGCDTRNDVLAEQLKSPQMKGGSDCTVASGTYVEPYFGTTEQFVRGEPTDEQDEIDHVFALRAAWDMGASDWTTEQRQVFANDTELNLLVSTRAANSGGKDVDGDGYTDRKDLGEYPGKSAKTAGEWLEWMTDEQRACNFAARYTLVAERYGLNVTESDATAMTEAFKHC